MTTIVKRIGIPGTDRYLELNNPDAGEWTLHELDGGPLRQLTQPENNLVNATYRAMWKWHELERNQLRANLGAMADVCRKMETAESRMLDDRIKVDKGLGKLRTLAAMACTADNLADDHYAYGLANGLLMAVSVMHETEYDPLVLPARVGFIRRTWRKLFSRG